MEIICPSCKNKISRLQSRCFISKIGIRKMVGCPHCGVTLILSKWPHLLLYAGWLLGAIALASSCLLPFPEVLKGFHLHSALFIVACVMVITGLFIWRLEVFNEPNT